MNLFFLKTYGGGERAILINLMRASIDSIGELFKLSSYAMSMYTPPLTDSDKWRVLRGDGNYGHVFVNLEYVFDS